MKEIAGRKSIIDLGSVDIANKNVNIDSDMQMGLNSFFIEDVFYDGKNAEEKGLGKIKGRKIIQDDSDDNFLYFKNRFKDYALFKVRRNCAAIFDVKESESKSFSKSEVEFAYIAKTFLTDCGDGVWAVCDKSYKEILSQLWMAKRDQVRIIID